MKGELKIVGWLRYAIFFSFYALSVRLILITIDHASINPPWLLVMLCLGIAGLSAWRTSWSLYLLIVAIPLVSGLQKLGFMSATPVLSLMFASLYVAWLPKKILLQKGGILPRTEIGHLVDILAGFVLLSLILTLGRVPLDLTLHRIGSPPASIMDTFFSIHAAYVLLQGLFFYRIIEKEVVTQRAWNILIALLFIQAAIIILFSLIQVIYRTPDLFYGFALFSPFDDIHSYGSYIAALFAITIALLFNSPPRFKLFLPIYAGILFLLIVLSYSRGTWLAVMMIVLFLIVYKLSIPKKLLVISSLLLLLLLVNLFPETLIQSNHPFLKRFGHLVVFKAQFDDFARVVLWKRGLQIIADFPLTGSGIGTFYRISPLYHDPGLKEYQDYHENAHNYFLQVASDLGLPALLIFFSILFYAFKAAFRVSSQNPAVAPSVKALLLGLIAYLITCMTGHPLLISSQQFFFWLMVASLGVPRAFSDHQGGGQTGRLPRTTSLFMILLTIMVLAGYGLEYGSGFRGPAGPEQKYEYGFYAFEDWKGKKVRWTSKKAALRTVVTGQVISFDVYAFRHNIGPEGLNFKLFINGKLWDEINFTQPEMRTLKYRLPLKKGDSIEIKTVVSRTFIPVQLGINPDSRRLGVAMSEIIFYD